jgi:hypothetical protein
VAAWKKEAAAEVETYLSMGEKRGVARNEKRCGTNDDEAPHDGGGMEEREVGPPTTRERTKQSRGRLSRSRKRTGVITSDRFYRAGSSGRLVTKH